MGNSEPSLRQRRPRYETREIVLNAAIREFSKKGYFGTAMVDIADSVGVSQPYVTMLFGNKKNLFIEVLNRGFDNVERLISSVDLTGAADPSDALHLLGVAFSDNLFYGKRSVDLWSFQIQMQAFASSSDPEIREISATRHMQLFRLLQKVTGASSAQVAMFQATGLYLNLARALKLTEPAEHVADFYREHGL